MQICVVNDLCLCWMRSIDRSIDLPSDIYLLVLFIRLCLAKRQGLITPESLELANLPENTRMMNVCVCALICLSIYMSVCLLVSLSVCLSLGLSLSVSWSPLRCLLASDPIKSHNCCCCCIWLPKLCQRRIIWTRFTRPPPGANGTYIYLDARVLIGKWPTQCFFVIQRDKRIVLGAGRK